jgi:hypothetical protein
MNIHSFYLVALIAGGGISSAVYSVIIYQCCSVLGWEFIVQKAFFFFFLSLSMEMVFYGITRLFMRLSHPIMYYGIFSVFLSGYASFAIPTGKEGIEEFINMVYIFIIFQVLLSSAGVIGFSTLFKKQNK